MPELFAQSWARAWTGCGTNADGAGTRDELLDRYAEPQRRYHTRQHLHECLECFDTVRALPRHPHEVELALWFHDAIYDPRRSDNEARSAAWAADALRAAGASGDVAQRVQALVLATRHEALPVYGDQQVLVDIDLAILGAQEPRFAEYERQIREEYAHVPGFLFRPKRRAILKGFLERPRIYGTEHFHAILEHRARANLARAIARRSPA